MEAGSAAPVAPGTEVHGGTRLAAQVLLTLGAIGFAVAVLRTFGSGRFNMGWDLAALIAGIALRYGGPRAAAIVRWLALAWLPGIAVLLVNQYAAPPADLTLTQFRLYPFAALAAFASLAVPCAVMFWLARALPKPKRARSTWIALALGVLTALFMMGMAARLLGGDDARRARDLVAAQYGNGYRYYTNSLNITRKVTGEEMTTVSATVVAWNSGQVMTVPVQWRR